MATKPEEAGNGTPTRFGIGISVRIKEDVVTDVVDCCENPTTARR
jgi:hypothetical protein